MTNRNSIFLSITLAFAAASLRAEGRHQSISILMGEKADAVELRYGQLLASRIARITTAPVTIGTPAGEAQLAIHLGTAESYPALAALASQADIGMPAPLNPGREGFVLASRKVGNQQVVLAIGADRRGVLYAVGEILRQMVGRGDAVEFPAGVHVSRAPRWPIRGLIVTQGETIRELTGSRHWTREELEGAHLDYALAGANTFEIGVNSKLFTFLKSYGLDTLTVFSANQGSGPPEWQAKEAIGRAGYLSPGIPEARAALIEQHEAVFKTMPDFDYVHFKSGDGGGDESEVSAPYGKALIRLCEDYARILHKYHPNTKVFVGNQKLDNAGDQGIFDYLNEKPRDWISGIIYGPGSNAMGWTPGRRQDHRMDLFEYAGRGGMGGYLREMLHQLPPGQDILLFTDLTHWVYSQYGLMDHELIPDRNHDTPPAWDDAMYKDRPDESLAMVYDRRTFHARPQNYYRVFQETAHYTVGDVAYSEGHHDHLNCWIYQRLFWNPHQSVEEVVGEYARTHFGPEAAPTMTEAIFTLEENLKTRITENPGIDRMIELTERAGERIPEDQRARNYLWREYLQKAYLDKYIQLDTRRQRTFYDERILELRAALQKQKNTRGYARSIQNLPPPDEAMLLLKSKADHLGQETDRLFGVRSEGFFNLQQDYVGLGWLMKQIGDAGGSPSEEESREILKQLVNYTNPGEGGFYDNAGVPGEAPHLIYGWPYGEDGFSNTNRPSQRTMAFTTDEERGATFKYNGLDRKARYRVRLCLVRPKFLPRFAMFQPQKTQSVYADDLLVAKDVELPEYIAGFFEYDIPPAATADGELTIWMKKQTGVGEGPASDLSIWRNTGGWGTLVSEIWLMKQ